MVRSVPKICEGKGYYRYRDVGIVIRRMQMKKKTFNMNKMLLMVITCAVVVIAVYMIKSLPVDYSWKIALGMGVVVNILIILIGCTALEVDMSIGGVFVSTMISALIVLIIQFFIFNVDYSRTENVQFEDDEYYYYVKAIPKVSVEAPDVNVKRFNHYDDYDDEEAEGDFYA